MNIIVIAKKRSDRDLITRTVSRSGAAGIAVEAVTDLPSVLISRPISGVIIDVLTAVRLSIQDKNLFDGLITPFPLLKVKVLGDVVIPIGPDAVDTFINQTCKNFIPRRARTSVRVTRHLGVFLADNPSFTQAEKTITVDVSEGGCFIFTTDPPPIGTEVWIKFTDGRVEQGTIAHIRAWDEDDQQIPGAGIKYALLQVPSS